MLDIYLWNFGKRPNSTLQPSTQGDLLQGELKDDFSPMHLNITFNFTNPNITPTYNYALIPSFANRYYYIEEWVYTGGLWNASLTIDVLATYKTVIGNSRQYVARAQTAPESGFTDYLIDSAYPTIGIKNSAFAYKSYANFWNASVADGIIVLGLLGGGTYDNVGAVSYYALSYDGARNFMQNLMDISAYGISDISAELQKALINPAQYIVSCQWLPVPYSYLANSGLTATQQLRVGWWYKYIGQGYAYILDDPGADKCFLDVEKDFPVQHHPDAATRGNYLNLSPYTTYIFRCFPFGVFELDSNIMAKCDNITVSYRINLITGDAVLKIRNSSWATRAYFFTTQCNVGVSIPTGQIAVNLGNFDQALMMGLVTGAQTIADNYQNSAANTTAQVALGKGGGGKYGGGSGRK